MDDFLGSCRDLTELLEGLAATHPLSPGDALIVLVGDHKREQRIEHVQRLARDEWQVDDYKKLSERIRGIVQSMRIPPWRKGGPHHTIVTVIARRGFTVFGSEEFVWLPAWRYSNHVASVFWGDLVLMTEHGWADFYTRQGGSTPCLSLTETVATASSP